MENPLAWMAERPLGVIATTTADETPHAVPVEIVVHDGKVYSWCHASAVRVAHLQRTARAAMLVYKGNAFVLVQGGTRLLHQRDPEYATVTTMFLEKYRRQESYGNDTLVELTPERIVARDH